MIVVECFHIDCNPVPLTRVNNELITCKTSLNASVKTPHSAEHIASYGLASRQVRLDLINI